MRNVNVLEYVSLDGIGPYTETNWHVNASTVRESNIAASTQLRLHPSRVRLFGK
jgi:hypothetical protein